MSAIPPLSGDTGKSVPNAVEGQAGAEDSGGDHRLSILSRGGVGATVGNASFVLLPSEPTDEGVERRREDEAEAGHAEHPEQHRCPQPTASGATPRMNASEVIRIGRRRVRAACTAASPEAAPSSSL